MPQLLMEYGHVIRQLADLCTFPRLSKNKAHLHNIATIFRREQGVQRFQRCNGEWHSVPQGAAAPWALLCNRFAVRRFST